MRMNNSVLKNLLLTLGLLTVAFAGYYMYTQQDAVTLNLDGADPQYQEMLNDTQAFIQRRQKLNQTKLDIRILDDERFSSLYTHTKPVKEVEAGRTDPFSVAEVGS